MSCCALAVNHGKATPSSGAMALLLACLLLPLALATTFHRIETIPFEREVEKGLVSEEDDEKGGGEADADAGFFLPYRKFTDIPGCD